MAEPELQEDPFLCMTREELLKLPLWQQKVVLAKDVIQLLDSKKILAKQGAYMDSLLPWAKAIEAYKEDDSRHDILLRDLFHEADATKEGEDPLVDVCGIGALFIAAVDKFNSLGCSALGFADANDDEILPYLDKWFVTEELRLIEAAFESQWCGGPRYESDQENEKEIQRAVEMFQVVDSVTGEVIPSDHTIEERMRIIMQNIIANEGTFVP